MSFVLIQVVPCFLQTRLIVAKKAHASIATLAQKATHLLCQVAMINTERLHLMSAYLAAAPAAIKDRFVLLWCDAVSRPEVVTAFLLWGWH